MHVKQRQPSCSCSRQSDEAHTSCASLDHGSLGREILSVYFGVLLITYVMIYAYGKWLLNLSIILILDMANNR